MKKNLEGRDIQYFSNLLRSNKNYCYKNTEIIKKRYIFDIFTCKIQKYVSRNIQISHSEEVDMNFEK